MCSRNSLRSWIRQLLPHSHPCLQSAGAQFVRALLVGYTTNLAQLARQLDRPGDVKVARQWLTRWLGRPQFAPTGLYVELLRLIPPQILSRRQATVPLLVDLTFFGERWVVLQVSLPWEKRSLPLLRITQPYQGPERSQARAVKAALAWVDAHLPDARKRCVWIMDRGFPGHQLLNDLRADHWRFVLRIEGRWRVTHPQYHGSLHDLRDLVTVDDVPGILYDAKLGERGRGPKRSSQAHGVYFRGQGHQAPWYLVTSERDPQAVVALYRQRMRIEQEFRDLKGFWGLDHLAAWQNQEQVEAFLAWLAVYEWRLAHLWLKHHLAQCQAQFRVGGKLSWIRTVREWLLRQLRLLKPIPDLRL